MPTKKRRIAPSEVELCRPVVAMLRSYGWEVYQEVYPPRLSGGCDIVATRGPVVWCIEAKKGWGLKILSQAIRWCPYAHWVSIATRVAQVPTAALPALSKYGIGTLILTWARDPDPMVLEEQLRPRLNRHARPSAITDWLCEEQKTVVPAGSSGEHWSPWGATCKRVSDFVSAHGPCTPKDLVKNIAHHYATPKSARQSIVQWIRAGKIPGVRAEHRLGSLTLFAVDEDETGPPELEVFDG